MERVKSCPKCNVRTPTLLVKVMCPNCGEERIVVADANSFGHYRKKKNG